MPQDAATQDDSGAALFVDMDGLLRESTATSQGRCLPSTSKLMLHCLSTKLDGALAFISGRRIADLDLLLTPYRFCCVGVHGGESRDLAGRVSTYDIDARAFRNVRAILSQLIERHPALELEDKGCALALHFEHDPDLRVVARTAMRSAADVLGAGFRLRTCQYAYEVHPSTATQAAAIAAFMEQELFRGRTPVLIGDDATDEDAFAYVRSARGLAVKVGTGSSMSALLDGIRWLDRIPSVWPSQGCR